MINQKINSYIGHSKEANEVHKFIKKYWKKNHFLSKNFKFFKWLYVQNSRLNVAIVRKNKRIVGIQGFIPQKKFDKKLSDNQITLTLSLTNQYAPPGILFKLFSTIKKKLSATFVSTSGGWFDPNIVKYNKLLGFDIYEMDHFFIMPDRRKFKIIKNNYKLKFKIPNLGQYKILNKITLKNIYKGIFVNKPFKSNKFLLNRYLNHPNLNYQIYEIFNKKKLKCLIVIRIINIKNNFLIKIVDYQGPKKNIIYLGGLLKHLLKFYNPEFIDFVCTGFPKNLLIKTGFKNRKIYKKLILPDYVNPLVMKNIDLKCGVIPNYKSNILIMRGDGDRDSPN
tara:strand:- start:493 stop:1500 length:1008 start_codon:yes stop_codon:yes gene_type:complete